MQGTQDKCNEQTGPIGHWESFHATDSTLVRVTWLEKVDFVHCAIDWIVLLSCNEHTAYFIRLILSFNVYIEICLSSLW